MDFPSLPVVSDVGDHSLVYLMAWCDIQAVNAVFLFFRQILREGGVSQRFSRSLCDGGDDLGVVLDYSGTRLRELCTWFWFGFRNINYCRSILGRREYIIQCEYQYLKYGSVFILTLHKMSNLALRALKTMLKFIS